MTKELEKNLFDIEPVNFLEDYKLDIEDLSYDLEKELRECSLPEDNRSPLERFKDYSRSCCTFSEIRSVMRMSLEELDKLAQSGGFKDTKDLMDYYRQETLDMWFDGIKASAACGNSKSKAFLKRYLSQYENQKRK